MYPQQHRQAFKTTRIITALCLLAPFVAIGYAFLKDTDRAMTETNRQVTLETYNKCVTVEQAGQKQPKLCDEILD